MVEDLEAEEAKTGPKTHDELKVEIEKLREAIEKLEKKETAKLTYRVPKAKQDGERELPMRSLEVGKAGEEERDSRSFSDSEGTKVGKSLDIDTEMPYGELEPFGREDTAQELTEASIHESDEMVDQLERAEVAEEKRAVFRALTRLRGAAITSFD